MLFGKMLKFQRLNHFEPMPLKSLESGEFNIKRASLDMPEPEQREELRFDPERDITSEEWDGSQPSTGVAQA